MIISTNGTEISGTIRATYYKNGERNIKENVMNGLGYEGIVESQIVASIGCDSEDPSNRVAGCNTEQRLELNKNGTTNTITSVQKDNWLLEPINTVEDGTSRTIKAQYYKNSVANFTRTGYFGATGVVKEDEKMKYRIRKLTPKETWRIMDFNDEDYEKAADVNSQTQLYKQAGNSIVRNVLVAIFGQMFAGHELDYESV